MTEVMIFTNCVDNFWLSKVLGNKLYMSYKILSVKNLTVLKKLLVCIITLVLTLGFSVDIYAQGSATELAFPGAQGFGKYSQGGKGGKLYIVNSLADDADNPAVGTLRYAINKKHARTIVFSVSGVIQLSAPLKISRSNITIAGQTSPGGITLAGAPVVVSKAKQVIIRYLRFRLGTFGYAEDALSVRNSEQIIIDHCSLSWSVDETGSFYNNRHFTLQNSIISDSLNDSIHPKGKHGYGGIWGGANASFINNILANHASRTPRLNGHRLKPDYPMADEFVEIANNIIFNWGHNNVYGSENGRFNLVNNYYKPGLASKRAQLADIWYSPLITENQVFIEGNFYQGEQQISDENWRGINYRTSKKAKRSQAQASTPMLSNTLLQPFSASKAAFEPTLSALAAFELALVKQNVGANRNANGPFVDNVDSLVYQQLADKVAIKGDGLINHEDEQIGSWSAYAQQFRQFPEVIDKNQDGIADLWLEQRGFTQKNGQVKPTASQLLTEYLNALAE